MLKTRVITAFLLLAILLPIIYSGSSVAFNIVATIFLGAAMWESQRLFKKPAPVLIAIIWAVLFAGVVMSNAATSPVPLFAMCTAFWIVRLIPSLRTGLPKLDAGVPNAVLSGMYGASIFACFIAISSLFKHSPLFLLSVMAMVWIADIGAYFSGKAFGKRKLAPGISPGKSWEGVFGGWIFVLSIGVAATFVSALSDTLPSKILNNFGWMGLVGLMTLLVAASVVGDLFESLLKRRAGMKDSSSLLPGHGGVLDRIDALIPVLPVAALIDAWLK